MNVESDKKALFMSIAGKPNTGKSSILNMLLGSKIAIVSPKPQTTRNRITGILTHGNVQTVFMDTPGIHKPRSCLGKYMDREITTAVKGGDACLHVVEAGKEPSDIDKNLIKKVRDLSIPCVLAINKIDIIKDKSVLINQMKSFSNIFDYSAIVPISAKTFEGKSDLLNEIEALSVQSDFFFPEDDITCEPERKIVSEIIREKALRLLNEEVPHGIAVNIESMKERGDGFTLINATIYCEREGHKGIIIGKGGSMLKKIGILARQDIEKLLDCRVNLIIWVKVKKDWRNKIHILKNLGYSEE